MRREEGCGQAGMSSSTGREKTRARGLWARRRVERLIHEIALFAREKRGTKRADSTHLSAIAEIKHADGVHLAALDAPDRDEVALACRIGRPGVGRRVTAADQDGLAAQETRGVVVADF